MILDTDAIVAAYNCCYLSITIYIYIDLYIHLRWWLQCGSNSCFFSLLGQMIKSDQHIFQLVEATKTFEFPFFLCGNVAHETEAKTDVCPFYIKFVSSLLVANGFKERA